MSAPGRSRIAGSTVDPHRYLGAELADLGQLGGSQFGGIFQPRVELEKALVGVTKYFLEDAGTYHAKYSNHQRFEFLIRRALTAISYEPTNPEILDIGSGSGNSVFPLLKMYPNSPVVACDISPNILAILRDGLSKIPGHAARCLLVATDIMNNHFRPAVFDLVVGAAILHHILDVERTLTSIHDTLKPGGVAIFFEPFEAGASILRMAFQHILDLDDAKVRYSVGSREPKAEQTLGDEMRRFLRRRIVDFDRRISPDVEIKKSLDDKWYFTRAYFEELAQSIGFSSLLILNNQTTDNPLLVQTQTYLRNGLGLGKDALPDFAWEILRRYEGAMSVHLKKEMMTAGTIILKR